MKRQPTVPGRFALALLVLLPSTTANAWWDLGHSNLCQAALELITPATRAAVDRLLAVEDADRTLRPQQFATACTWADNIKRERPETRSWHYLNAPRGTVPVTRVRRPDDGDILTAIEVQLAILGDHALSDWQRAEALRFVAHLIGDLHQPLHLGLAFDRGGNRYGLEIPQAIAPLISESERNHTTMHALWDGYLLLFARNDNGQPVLELIRRELAASSPAPIGTPLLWAQESLDIARQPATAYATGERLRRIDRDYLQHHAPTAIRRLSLGAKRLAALLDRTLSDEMVSSNAPKHP